MGILVEEKRIVIKEKERKKERRIEEGVVNIGEDRRDEENYMHLEEERKNYY